MSSSTDADSKSKSCLQVNQKFLPFKIHYFLLCGAHVGIIPFLPVFAKIRLDLSATTVGILSTFMQLSNALSKPLFGFLADFTNRIRALLISLICVEALLVLLIVGIPSATQVEDGPKQYSERNVTRTLHSIKKICHEGSRNSHQVEERSAHKNYKTNLYQKEFYFSSASKETSDTGLTSPPSKSCCHQINKVKCNLHCYQKKIKGKCYSNFPHCADVKNVYNLPCKLKHRMSQVKKFSYQSRYFNISYEFKLNLNQTLLNTVTFAQFPILGGNETLNTFKPKCKELSDNCSLECDYHFDTCHGKKDATDYDSSQFWMFATYSILSVMAQGAIYSLSDTICYENLKSSASNYGHQRFFGAIGWGSVAILTGFLNSLANDDPNRCYTPGFYLMVVLSAFLILNTHHIDMKLSSHKVIGVKPKNLYVSKEFLCFEVCILASGMLTAYTSCYMIWYIENLGGSQLLGGFALSIQCLLGEALFMYFSDSLISTFGHWNIVTASFLTFAIRYYGYYMLNNPWFILPLEILHGITYGLFYSTMTSYAKEIAPAGSEATVQGIFSGTFQGLGTGFGSFVAGTSIDAYGGRMSFLIAAIFSTFAALVSSILSFIVKDSRPVLIELK